MTSFDPPTRRPTKRVCAAFALLVAAPLMVARCGSGEPTRTYLAEYVPFSSSGIDTGLMFPLPEGSSRFLVQNWPPLRDRPNDDLWIHGTWSRLRFASVADGISTFVAEARPFAHPDAPTQTMTVTLNGSTVSTTPMQPGWRTYEIELPADALNIGWNELELRFRHTLRPSDFDPNNNDSRTLAAQFRRLEIRRGSGRPDWSERPEGVALQIPGGVPPPEPAVAPATPIPAAGDAAAGSGNTATGSGSLTPGANSIEATLLEAVDLAAVGIEMPVGSFMDVFLLPGADTELTGNVAAVFADADAEAGRSGAGEIRTVFEILTPEAVIPLWETTLGRGTANSTTVQAGLEPWAGRLVGLRVRVLGSGNGVVRWTGLAVSNAAEATDAPSLPGEAIAPPSTGELQRPDIFVVLLDAARADVFEGDRGAELAPNVQELAAQGTRFTRAWSPSSWTGQSVPAILTGMMPDAVGAEHWGSRLPAPITSLPEIMLDAGYHTVLWSQHNIYRGNATLRHGFEVFEEVRSNVLEDRRLLPSAADLLDADKPTFALIHLLPPHAPYQPPPPFAGSRSGWYSGELAIDAELLNRFDDLVADEQRAEARRYAISAYEENVRFADHLVGRIVEELRAAGRYDDAVVIVLSDHGEAFNEHGRFLHTRWVYDEYLNVPLVIKWPRGMARFEPAIDAPVSLIDIAPTLVGGLGIEDERVRYQGRSLMPLVTGDAPPNRMIYAYSSGQTDPERPSRPQRTIRWKDMKLISSSDFDLPALYRLSEDPGELTDLAESDPFYAGVLLQSLKLTQSRNARILLAAGGGQIEDLDADTIEKLRALGYLR